MEELARKTIEVLNDFTANTGFFTSFFIGIFIIVLESIIPILPLGLFVAFNVVVFGNILGFIMSFVATLIGCSLSFIIFRKVFSKFLYKNINKKPKIKKIMKKINSITFTQLVIIMAIPFTPAFSINIGAGLSNISYKKFILAASIAKISIVYFWGYIGSTFIESITDTKVLVKLCIIILIGFLISKIVTKKFKFE